MEQKIYPTISLSTKWENGNGGFLIYHWCRVFKEHLPKDCDLNQILTAKRMADKGTGVRCFAVDVLFSCFVTKEKTIEWIVALVSLIAKAGSNYRSTEIVTECLNLLDAEVAGLGRVMIWCVPTDIEEPFNYYKFFSYPSVELIRPGTNTTHSSEPGQLQPAMQDGFARCLQLSMQEGLDRCKTRSQRDALRRLVSITNAIEWSGGKLGDITLNKSALMVAPSGSGKTWLVKLAGRVLGLPVHCYTVSGWSPRDSYSRHDSMSLAIKQVEGANDGCIIFLDEICKISNNGMGGSSNYWKTCQTEIMQLVTGDVSDFPTTPQFRENFGKCWFIFAGAFQDLYRDQLGTESPSTEQVERLDITLDDVIASRMLPDELINRTGAFVHLAPPGMTDIRLAMIQVELAAGISIPEKERETYADEIVSRMQGFRGLENYALRIAQEAFRMEQKSSSSGGGSVGKRRKKSPPRGS